MRVAIVPYRDRGPQLRRLLPQLEREFDRVVVCEQLGPEPFNRGAVRNLGFVLAAVPPDAVVCFHDVDLLPDPRRFQYRPDPPPGTVLHLYGHRHCLGGIVVCRAADFVRAGGYPTALWGWGGEDVELERRLRTVATIDRSRMRPRFDPVVAELDPHGEAMPPALARDRFLAAVGPRCAVGQRVKEGLAVRRPEPLRPKTEWWSARLVK
jgi:hypothetical protein